MYNIKDLFLIYDLSVDSLDDGMVKNILSSARYKESMYNKIRDKYPQISRSKNLIKDMSVTFEVLPMTNLSGRWEVKTRNGEPIIGCYGKPLVSYRWTPNYEVDVLLRKYQNT